MRKSIAYYLEDYNRLDELSESDLKAWISEMPFSQPLYKLQELKMQRAGIRSADILHQNAAHHTIDIDHHTKSKKKEPLTVKPKTEKKRVVSIDLAKETVEELATDEQVDILSLYAEKEACEQKATPSFIDGILMDIGSIVQNVTNEPEESHKVPSLEKENIIDPIDLSQSKLLEKPISELTFGTDKLEVEDNEIEHIIDFMDDMILDIESLVDGLGEKEIIGIDPIETKLSQIESQQEISATPKVISIHVDQEKTITEDPVEITKELTDVLASDELEELIETEVSETFMSSNSIDTELSSLVEKYNNSATDHDFILTYDDIMDTKIILEEESTSTTHDNMIDEIHASITAPSDKKARTAKSEVKKKKKKKKVASKKTTKNKNSKKKKKKKVHLEPLELVKEIRYVYLDERQDKDFRMHEYKGESEYVKWLLQKKSINKLGKKESKKKGKKKIDNIVLKSAEQSVKKRDVIISETLADILAAQGHNKKAKKMYKQLSLIFPEKSAYFAAKIKKLKKD